MRFTGSETVSVRGSATVSVRDLLSASPFSTCSLVIRMNRQTVADRQAIGVITHITVRRDDQICI